MEFDPSRFLTEDGQKVVTPDAFIPFSIGMAIVVNINFDRCKNLVWVWVFSVSEIVGRRVDDPRFTHFVLFICISFKVVEIAWARV